MNLHLEDFMQGVKIAMEAHEKGHNIFDIKGGSMFPNIESQKTWQFSRTPSAIHLSDGTNTYTFHGALDPEIETNLEKHPDVPLPDMYKDSTGKGKAQVHRANPGSIYFTLQEGTRNPTYTLRHTSENKWVAIPKARKAKKQLEQPAMINNINVEQLKQGAEQEFSDQRANGGAQNFFKTAFSVGGALKGLLNLPSQAALLPARIGGAVTNYGDQRIGVGEGLGDMLGHAAQAGLVGAGAGGLYHLGRQAFYNTPEENEQENKENALAKRMLYPAGAFAGLNAFGRSLAPYAINNPEARMFP